MNVIILSLSKPLRKADCLNLYVSLKVQHISLKTACADDYLYHKIHVGLDRLCEQLILAFSSYQFDNFLNSLIDTANQKQY